MWGQVNKQMTKAHELRIIPTRVGTSQNRRVNRSSGWDHPHACGDKYENDGTAKYWYWIIPTRVGTSCLIRCYTVRSEDHPHACGDKPISFLFLDTSGGSSPRVWGQGIVADVQFCPPGIIPTRVGTSTLYITYQPPAWDHPHACGDKNVIFVAGTDKEGSSPRVWGQARRNVLRRHKAGIIPTRVGTRAQGFL